MRGQFLLSLRFLKSSFSLNSFSQINASSTFHLSRTISIFNPIFSRNYANSPLISTPSAILSGIRTLSSRSSLRNRPNLDTSRGQGKSLIEDEAELSDWIDDLKTDSFHLGLSSDSEDSNRGGRGRGGDSRGRDRNSLSSPGRSRGRGREGFSSSKMLRDIDSDNDDNDNVDFPTRDRRGSRNLRGSVSKRRFDSDSGAEEEDDDDNADFPTRCRRGSRNLKGSISKRRFDSDSGGEEEDDDVSLKGRRKYRSQDGFSKVAKRRENDSGLSYGSSRKGGDLQRAGMGSGKRAFQFSDEKDGDDDDDDDKISGFEDSEEDVDIDVFNRASSLPESAKEGSAHATPETSTGTSASYLSQTRFDQCSISPLSLKGIKAAGFERMTVVQEATLPIILRGKDVLAKARTGTGKTVAFLLPSIEVITKLPPPDRDQKRAPINVLIVCPTRELANQAAAEANALLKYHPSIGVQVVMGGTRLALEQKRMQTNPCQILVATPGRLKDHMENTPGFATRLMGVKVLVLDEADHLLDMGFRKDIEKIVAAVPKQRQTLLFSATVPDEVRQICHIALKRDYEFINTVAEGSEETHTQVKQMHLIAPLDQHFPLLYALLKEHVSENVDYKVLVFCTTAMVTRMVADLLSELKLNVREIHSRKSQSYRTKVSDEFRKSKGLILVTSDVSARGVDYPDVTLVVQVGLPAEREQYIHRLGRTGRKGKEGKGILLLAPWEEFFLSSVRDLPITKASSPLMDPDTRRKVELALSHVDKRNKEAAYQAWLGYYNSNRKIGQDKFRLVELANEFSRSMGLDNPPAIPKLVLGKMGLKNVPGLRAR